MTTLFKNNTIDDILETVEFNARWMFEKAEEIGTSDVNCCVYVCLNDLKIDEEDVTDIDFRMLKNAVHNVIHEF